MTDMKSEPKPANKVVRSDDEWRKILTPLQYEITRKQGTERPFSGQYYNCKIEGTYVCVCCGTPLFSSRTKYNSGTGWPSFFAAIDSGHVTLKTDLSHGMIRTEAKCSRCDAHLGHVFEDGPAPTGLRYCVNSASLELVRKEGNNRK